MANLPFNWFDITLAVALAIGLIRGRKNGMTKEMIPMVQWIMIVVLGGLCYSLIAQIFLNTMRLDKAAADILGYLLIAVVIFIPFNYLKRKYTDKLAVSNFFGNLEFYLGMLGGMIRFACMALFALAMLNAPFYSQQQIINQQNYDKANFGGGTYEGSYFPHLFTIQDDVFVKSFTGPQIKNFLNPLLITTIDTAQTQRKSASTSP